jgi:hypothetical protein
VNELFQRLVANIFESMDGFTRGKHAVTRTDLAPLAFCQEKGAACQHQPPFVFVFMIMGRRAAAGRSHVGEHGEFSASLTAIQMNGDLATEGADDAALRSRNDDGNTHNF